MNTIPEGFTKLQPMGPFHELVGQMFCKMDDDTPIVGIIAEDKHRNKGDMMHGGMVSMLVDTATIWSVQAHKKDPENTVTLTTNITVDFLGKIKVGDWVEARVNFIKGGNRVMFAECYLWANDKVVARGSAQIQVVQQR